MKLRLPLKSKEIAELRAGDTVYLSGEIYTARDAAHKRLCDMISGGEKLPVDLKNAAIYYAGPCPPMPGQIINSCGPTSALRMDAYAPVLFDFGVRVTIAKGPVADRVKESIVKNGAVYLCATGGAGALISRCVKKAEIAAFEDLGTEAIRKLEVEDMPLVVGIDSKGRSLFR